MSKAGVHSNQGDAYQTVVAFEWAMAMLHGDIDWIEIDATSLDPKGDPVAVDDVVVRFTNGRTHYCQCKKNQPLHQSWSVSELSSDLEKTIRLLVNDPDARVSFYSRSSFGDLSRLVAHAQIVPNAESFNRTLAAGLLEVRSQLEKCWNGVATATYSVYEMLCRLEFKQTDISTADLKRSLGLSVSSVDRVFNSMWTNLDLLGARLAGDGGATARTHRISKADLRALVETAGGAIGAPRSLKDLAEAFSRTSAVGRNWKRSIGTHKFRRRALNELHQAVAAKERSVLIADGPGSGKTCVLLDLLEELEKNPNLATLFVQGREFSDCKTQQDYVARGLSVDLIADVARMSEFKHTVVVIDSLDVLSVSREHATLQNFLSILDRLQLLPNTTTVSACRSFDLKYHSRLADRKWNQVIALGELDWDHDVRPVMLELGVSQNALSDSTRKLILNPRNLAMFVDVVSRAGAFNIATAQALTKRYLDVVVRNDPDLGEAAMWGLERLATQMLVERRLSISRSRVTLPQPTLLGLQSAEVLQQDSDGHVSFTHQTLLDSLAVLSAEHENLGLLEFINKLPAVPFVRPAVRSFAFELLTAERKIFRQQIRAVFDADIAFHLKRLIAESWAETAPQAEDWSLILHLYRSHTTLFDSLYTSANAAPWFAFWQEKLIPLVVQERQAGRLTRHLNRVGQWKNELPEAVLEFWISACQYQWTDQAAARATVLFSLHDFSGWSAPNVRDLFVLLLREDVAENDRLGLPLSKWVEASDSGDDLLWRFITKHVTHEVIPSLAYSDKLRCSPHELGDTEFLARRMKQSENLLDHALNDVTRWSQIIGAFYGSAASRHDAFLSHTSFGRVHAQHEAHHISAVDVLMLALEGACIDHAKRSSPWWQQNEVKLRNSKEWGLIYIAVLGYCASPETNIDSISNLLRDRDILESRLNFEIGNLIHNAFIFLTPESQDEIMEQILQSFEERDLQQSEYWRSAAQLDLLMAIPMFLRSPQAQDAMSALSAVIGVRKRAPATETRSGYVIAPFSYEEFLRLSDSTIISLLAYYANEGRSVWDVENLIGGSDSVAGQLRDAAGRQPSRFAALLFSEWEHLSPMFRDALLDGVANNLRFRFGNLQAPAGWTSSDESNPIDLADQILDSLEENKHYWRDRREGAQGIGACAYVIETDLAASRLLRLSEEFAKKEEKDTTADLLTAGINSVRGVIAEAMMNIAIRWAELKREIPASLRNLLLQFSVDPRPSVRAVLLLRIAYLQYLDSDLGWRIFDYVVAAHHGELLALAERSLYYAYHSNFNKVVGHLAAAQRSSLPAARETWGRISMLACLSGHIAWQAHLKRLLELGDSAAWKGTVSVLSSNVDKAQHAAVCFTGLRVALSHAPRPTEVARQMSSIFYGKEAIVEVPIDLIQDWFTAMSQDGQSIHLHGFDEWLARLAESSPVHALEAAEVFAKASLRASSTHYDHRPIAQLLTRLFGEAEEREVSDRGAMLRRVISMQDDMLNCGVYGLHEWLRDAERP